MPRKQKKYHFIYKTTNTINNKFYIGMHSTDNLNDGYLGSGKRLWYSIRKYGKENHKIEIIEFFENREKLKIREIEIVNEKLLQNPMCMNIGLGGEGGLHNEEHAKKFHAAGGKKVLQLLNKRHINKLKNDKNYYDKFIKSIKDSIPLQTGINNPFYNKKHSKETKKQIGLTNSIKQKGEKNSQYGKYWITNGKENKLVKKENIIPNGWILGRKMK